MRDRASGIDDRPVHPDREEKSISAEDTFERDLGDPGALRAQLSQLADRACERLRKKQLMARCIGIKIRRADFTTFTRRRVVAPPTHDGRTIAKVANELLARWLTENPGEKLRLLGVVLSDLSAASQLGLFEDTPAPRAVWMLPWTRPGRASEAERCGVEIRSSNIRPCTFLFRPEREAVRDHTRSALLVFERAPR